MNKQQIQILKSEGWEVECQSPLEIRHEDGSFASLNAADIVIREILADTDVRKFTELALGVRFKYIGQDQVWIKIDPQLVAKYDYEMMKHDWTGQTVCSATDTEEQLNNLKVIVVE